MHLYIPFVIIFAILLFLSKSKSIYNSYHFNRYIQNIPQTMYTVKINGYSLNFRKKYLSLLQEIPNEKRQILIKYTAIMNNYFINNDLANIAATKTNYIMSRNGLEKNLPFTLANVIVLNQKFITKLSNKIDKTILETIIHEKLHIIQRSNQDKFDKFYPSVYPFLFKTLRLEELPISLKTKHMTNPDNNFKIWLYKIKNKVYLPLLEYDNGKLTEVAYESRNLKQKVLLSDILDSKDAHSHPNEIFAYTTSKEILNNTLPKLTLEFLKTI